MSCCRKAAVSSLILALLLIVPFLIYADSDVKSVKRKYQKIQKEIKEKKKAIKKAKEKEVSILAEIEQVSKELEKIKKEIKAQKRKIRKIRKRISALRGEMAKLSRRIKIQRQYLTRKLQAIQKYGTSSRGLLAPSAVTVSPEEDFKEPLLLMLTAEDLPQLIRHLQYLKKMAEYEYNILNDYSENLEGIKQKKQRLSALLAKLNAEKNTLLKKEKNLRSNKAKKRQLLASVRKERYLYKRMLSELKASARRLRKIIEESEKARYALKGFSKMKRRLPWPVNGSLALPYGSYKDPRFKTPVFRNGIHIRAKEGAIVKAVYPGKVVFADWFRGYGKVVIVTHGEGYYTVYANLSEIFLSKGDIIKGGEEIGRVGESGTLSAPALYFEVRYKGKPLNPLHWLKKRRS